MSTTPRDVIANAWPVLVSIEPTRRYGRDDYHEAVFEFVGGCIALLVGRHCGGAYFADAAVFLDGLDEPVAYEAEEGRRGTRHLLWEPADPDEQDRINRATPQLLAAWAAADALDLVAEWLDQQEP